MYATHRVHFPFLFWRETTPQHFDTEDGLYRRGAGVGPPPNTCKPIAGVTLQADHSLATDLPDRVCPISGA